MYKKILIAFDGSKPSAHALEHGMNLAVSMNSVVISILHVDQNLPLGEPVVNVNFDSLIEEEDRELLLPAVDRLESSGLHYETHTLEGDPAQVITSFAKEHSYDVIVMGSTGKSILKEAFLGSVSHEVAHSAGCPVLMVK